MANELHTTIIDPPITKQNLIDQGFKIDKHRVMVDSRAYEEEAFEYILKLADIAGAIVFVYDTKKIWANGRYFGGDIFEEDLKYFSTIQSFDDYDNLTGSTSANAPLSYLSLKGKSHLEVMASQDNDSNLIEFNYNLENAVNSADFITIGDTRYNLVVENDQIKLNEYVPMKVSCGTLSPLEYDSVDEYATISFKINASGSMPNKDKVKIAITSEPNIDDTISQNESIVNAQIPRNTAVTFTVKYEDGITFGETKITQKWGYGVWAGTGYDVATQYDDLDEAIGILNEDDYKKYIWVPGSSFLVKQPIDQKNEASSVEIGRIFLSYGVFIAPEQLDYEFTDMSTNLSGGWRPIQMNHKTMYDEPNTIDYAAFRTDNSGLGKISWEIKGTKNI